MTNLYKTFFVVSMVLLSFKATYAQESNKIVRKEERVKELDSIKRNPNIPFSDSLLVELPQVHVVVQRNSILAKIPGSVTIIDNQKMEQISPITSNELFRSIPGVNAVDEEGAGLRANIGIRGMDPDRSRGILVLEDGIPVSLAPYGEPELYYTPPINRMKGVEMLKGSGQILYGPQTSGGVLNYITADPTQDPNLDMSVIGGSGAYMVAQGTYSDTYESAGYMINYLRKQANEMGYANFRINDLNGKLRLQLSDRSALGIKMGIYQETSNSTYLGITQTMYDAGNQDFAVMAPDDKLNITRYSLSLSHFITFNPDLNLNTTAYAYTTTRNWQRQNFVRNANSDNNPTGIIWGDPSIPGGAVYMQNSNSHRNRSFSVAGIESRTKWYFNMFNFENTLDAGVRFHYEKAHEQRIDGTSSNDPSGSLREEEARTGYAVSGFVQDQMNITDKFTLTPGVRFEEYIYARDIYRLNNVSNPNYAKDNIFTVIPGVGATYDLDQVTVFAGVHRGYAPPRTKDAIDNSGRSLELDPELSWNYELGTRFTVGNILSFELTGFIMDFQNKIISTSASSGSSNGTGYSNGGSTLHKGIEMGGGLDISKWWTQRYGISIDAYTTLVSAKFNGNQFAQTAGGEWVSINGNYVPYAPKALVNGGISYRQRVRSNDVLSARLSFTFVGEQFSDDLNTFTPVADGLTGVIDSYFLLDLTAAYLFKDKYKVLASCKNLTNERYIASRRPEGIKVGLPAFFTLGVEVNL